MFLGCAGEKGVGNTFSFECILSVEVGATVLEDNVDEVCLASFQTETISVFGKFEWASFLTTELIPFLVGSWLFAITMSQFDCFSAAIRI